MIRINVWWFRMITSAICIPMVQFQGISFILQETTHSKTYDFILLKFMSFQAFDISPHIAIAGFKLRVNYCFKWTLQGQTTFHQMHMSEHTLAVGPVQIERRLYCAHDAGSPCWTPHHVTWHDNPVPRGLILIDSLIWLGDPSTPRWGRDSLDLTRWRAAGLTAASFCLWDCSDTHVGHIIQCLITLPVNIIRTCDFISISSY